LAQDPKLMKIIDEARKLGPGYKAPDRHDIAGKYLDALYVAHWKEQMKTLLLEARVFGITVFGDSATIKTVPLVNVLASCVNNPFVLLEIANCTAHLAKGGKKDAKYIAKIIMPLIQLMESEEDIHKKTYSGLIDLVFFDGASNVQNAGKILHAFNPRFIVEHAVPSMLFLCSFPTFTQWFNPSCSSLKSGQWVNAGIDKTKKQVLIFAQYQQTRAQARITKLAAAGKLWEDEDFASMKMDPFCKEIKESLQGEQMQKEVRILRLWQERWELEKIGPNGDSILEARLTKKYKGLKIFDIDENNRVMTAHKMIFQKKRGNNLYHVFAMMDGFNDVLKDEDEANDAYWQPWEVNEDLFDCMRVYYKEQADSNVKCYELGGDCQSDDEE